MRRLLAMALAVALVMPLMLVGAGSAIAGIPVSGAIFTTDVYGGVNINIYDSKGDVYLNGGPRKPGAAGLPDGYYYVQVTDPNGATVLGRSFPDTIEVSGGEFVTQVRLVDFLYTASSGFLVNGFDDTGNPGGVYKAWASKNPNFPTSESKTDNFKVKQSEEQEYAKKVWRLQVPAALLLLPDMTYRAWYTSDDPNDPEADWDFVDLLQASPGSLFFTAETMFEIPTTIWWWWEASGPYYNWSSEGEPEGPESFAGAGPYVNGRVLPQGTKSWSLTVGPRVPGASYFGAWSVDQTTWFEVPLTEQTPPGLLWQGANPLPDGLNYYWKFFGKVGTTVFWTTGVLGPETMTVDGLLNEWFYSQPRTIGYWMNWMNHFTDSEMAKIVAGVNSDANGFSSVFRAGTANVAGDTGYYRLLVGGKKSANTALNPTVAYYLGQAQSASLMFQMLRAQLLGVELNVAVTQVGAVTFDRTIVGLSPTAKVYLYKVPGGTTAINPWSADADQIVTVQEIISTIEGAAASDWGAWSRARQEFAKNVCDHINNDGSGGSRDIGILNP